MSEFQYKAGLNNVGSYQISGIPFVSGGITAPSSSSTPVVITFPSVTQRIWIHNSDTTRDLRIGFSENGIKNNNYFIVSANNSNSTSVAQEIKVRTDKIFLLGNDSSNNTTNISVLAELTGISGYELTETYSGSSGIG